MRLLNSATKSAQSTTTTRTWLPGLFQSCLYPPSPPLHPSPRPKTVSRTAAQDTRPPTSVTKSAQSTPTTWTRIPGPFQSCPNPPSPPSTPRPKTVSPPAALPAKPPPSATPSAPLRASSSPRRTGVLATNACLKSSSARAARWGWSPLKGARCMSDVAALLSRSGGCVISTAFRSVWMISGISRRRSAGGILARI